MVTEVMVFTQMAGLAGLVELDTHITCCVLSAITDTLPKRRRQRHLLPWKEQKCKLTDDVVSRKTCEFYCISFFLRMIGWLIECIKATKWKEKRSYLILIGRKHKLYFVWVCFYTVHHRKLRFHGIRHQRWMCITQAFSQSCCRRFPKLTEGFGIFQRFLKWIQRLVKIPWVDLKFSEDKLVF